MHRPLFSQLDVVRMGSVRMGSVRMGSVRMGSVRMGSVRMGSARAWWTALAFFAALVAIGWVGPTWATDPLQGALKVGGTSVPSAHLKKALDLCRSDISDLTPLDCLKRYWVPRFLLDQEAKTRKLADRAATAFRIDDLLHRALAEKIAGSQAAPSEQELEEYIGEHRRDFEKPLRIRLFRILLDDENAAKELIAKLRSGVTVAQFRDLARAQSVDRATHERGGDLGFVWPDGSTDIPQVSAEKALYQAALELEDGQLCEEPVAEGKRFAVLLRAGSLPPLTVDERSREIARLRLIEARTEAELQAMLQQAQETTVKNRDDVLLGKLRRKEATLFSER